MSIRTRLTIVSAVLIAVALAAVGSFLYVRLQGQLIDAVDAGLRSRADALLAGPAAGLAPGTLVESDEAFAQVLGVGGQVLDASPGLPDRPLVDVGELATLRGTRFVETTVVVAEGEEVPARLLLVPVTGAEDRMLVVGASLEDQREALARLAGLLAILGPVAVALVVWVNWLAIGAALRPVEAMRIEAAAISASEPGRRLPVGGTEDELGRLGETLNAMLERLEEALERERRFVDDASHELRTPLSNLKAELDLALRRSRTREELEGALRSASEETDRLSRLAEDLLVLARSEGGRLPVRREPVELAGVVTGVADSFSARAAERGVAIESDVPADLRADLDELRIRQALGNLVDNAVRHTPAGGRVIVEASRDDGIVRLEVRDTGPGFPPEYLPRAFDAFARPDADRGRVDGGSGLGLAIVRAVAEAHGGTAAIATDPGGGATVVLSIPG